MDWDMGGSSGSSDGSLGKDSVISNADAAALGLNEQPPDFYDPDADDKDEEWANRMRRSHHSDAIISCPLCFTTLCIDCQQHERYDNQFRAMFVMNCRVKTGERVTVPSPPPKRGKQKKRQQEAQQQQQQQQQSTEQQQQQGAQQAACTDNQQQQQQQAQPQAQQQAAGEQAPAEMCQPAAAPQAPTGQPPSGTQAHADASSEVLNPVCCAVCETEVGLRDAADGCYHFFNVFASNS